MEMDHRLFVMGDAHGHLDVVKKHLRSGALIDQEGRWTGGQSHLWFIGDFFDRGPDGSGVVELVMRLQEEAAVSRGFVGGLLGNHELFILGARRFGYRGDDVGSSFVRLWLANGGLESDLLALGDRELSWLEALPALHLEAERLLVHADTLRYLEYGDSIEAINRSIRQVIQGDDVEAWQGLLEAFCSREDFEDRRPDGRKRAELLLDLLGGEQIIHGHTPIDKMAKVSPRQVTEALVYAGGRCVDVDGGIYRGGPGFLYEAVRPGLPQEAGKPDGP
ncbi:MAG TPA: metallophosphoesterase [Chloroflexota bacterium]|nr:metallophosphoesterase [Chloroflexota bacterium]